MDDLLADAPHIIDHLCDDCEAHFADLRGLLDALDQSYSINFRLVRGIDYYTKTVFEVWAEGIGAQAAVCGGGRYDGLAEDIGGPSTPGVGFGSGIERIVLGMQEAGLEPPAPEQPAVLVAHFGGATKEAAVQLAFQLRAAEIGTRLAFARDRRSMKSQMRKANRAASRLALIVGDNELAAKKYTLKNMGNGEQQEVAEEDLTTAVTSALGSPAAD
jgi:histidyl-tRNA synthetase